MILENQVCTPKQGEKLKALGVKQESLFYWTHSDWGIMHKSSIDFSGNPTSVFTVAELGMMLPDLLETHLQYELVCIKEGNDEWLCRYVRNNDMCDLHPTAPTGASITEAQTRAEILISLLEEKLTTPDEVNQRLLAE